MKHKFVQRVLAVILLIAGCVVIFSLMPNSEKPGTDNGRGIIPLMAPSFISAASAEGESPDEGTSFLEDEAGISAYTRTPFPIDLSLIRDLFRTIERETSAYIIGSIELSGYGETEDAHVYVHTDGWVLAYYLAQDPAGKIMDWIGYNGSEITSTKLENALAVLCNQVGAMPFDPSYYDFRYPNATNLMIVAEANYGGAGSGGDTFEIKLPGGFVFYERSWSLGTQYTSGPYPEGYFYLNDDLIKKISGGGWQVAHGTLTHTQLPPGSFHTVEIWRHDTNAFGSLVFIYKEVP